LGTAGLTASTGADASTIASASSAAQNVAENNALKAAVTVTKIIYKAGKRVVKNGRIKMDDLKQIVKDEGLDILDNVLTLADGTLSWDDGKAIIDLVVGTSLNGASKGKALEKINEIVGGKSTTSGMLGSKGTQLHSTTVWKGRGKERIDVENPAPGQRPGQVHYQDIDNQKYYYQSSSNSFTLDPEGKTQAPKAIQRLLDSPSFANGISKALRYLGE
jgi:hypothetical protein